MAKREFEEELGSVPPLVVFRDLGSIRQPGGEPDGMGSKADFDAAGVPLSGVKLTRDHSRNRLPATT
jgi:predicted NUDIX family NTP pyrophosphohydrolase